MALCQIEHPFSVYPNCISSILCAFLECNPSAIFGSVIAFTIFTINNMPERRLPHVCKKVFKLKPTATHRNAQGSVLSISFMLGIVTPCPNSLPSNISSALFGKTMRSSQFASRFSTRRCVPVTQTNSGDFFYCTAPASNLPKPVTTP